MRRIAIAALLLAGIAAYWACSSDAPTPTSGGGGGTGQPPSGSSALVIQLFTNNPNPTAGSCSAIQAIVKLNGANVPDGTGVQFSTDFGVFAQNGLPLISVTTQNGAAVTAICSDLVGLAKITASAKVGSNSATATITISFQASTQAAPFVTFCNPSSGPNTGGTSLVISGGRFPGNAGTTRATFTALGITREALVTNLTPTSVTVTTPAFPEALSPTVPVNITLTFNTNSASPITVSVPNCFVFGTAAAGTPSITAVLPSSGTNEGNTRVTIVGSGFAAPLQVFFGPVEATVLSISFNQIVALTPPAFGAGAPNLNQSVTVRVHEVTSGLDATLPNGFRFTPPVQIISFEGANEQPFNGPFTPLTIHGQGFQAPVKVALAGVVATVMSVSATEIVVLPNGVLPTSCADVTGPITVTNIDTGDTASALTFRYFVKNFAPFITSVSSGAGSVTISGGNFVLIQAVTVGGKAAAFTVNSSNTIVASLPSFTPPSCGSSPVGTPLPVGDGTVVVTTTFGCSVTASGVTLPCTASPADLELTKTATPGTVTISSGSSVTFSLLVKNTGGQDAANTVVTDPLPSGWTFISCSATSGPCSGGSTVVASLGTIAAGGSASVTIQARPNAPGSFNNTASVSTSSPEINTGNNTSTATVTVNP